jgi:hypothetical protein
VRIFWHVTCKPRRQDALMAGKMNVMKMLQEIRGLAVFGHRRPLPRQPGSPPPPWRSQFARGAASRRRRTIRIAMQTPSDIPDPVKITHLKHGATQASARPAP